MARPFRAIAALVVALTVFLIALPQASTRADSPLAFHDPLGRFSFAIPPGWHTQLATTPGVVVRFAGDTVPGTGNVTTESIGTSITLDAYASATTTAILRAYPDFQTSGAGIEQTILGGQPARRWELTDIATEAPLVITQYAVLMDATAYVITFVCAEADVASFRNQAAMIVETFTFSDVFPLA